MDRPAAQILVVEDETLQRTLLLDSLRTSGHMAIGAGSAEEAMGLLAQHSVEVAVVDVFLPGRSGIEFLRALRSASPETDVVVITGRPTVRVAVDCIQSGAFDFLLKPVEPDKLESSVSRAIEHSRTRKRARLVAAAQEIAQCQRDGFAATVVEIVRDSLGADETSLMVPRSGRGLCVAASTSLDPELQARICVRIGERVVGRVAAEREPLLLLGSLRQDPRFSSVEANERLLSSIVHPLLFGGALQGVLTVGRRRGSRPFREVDMEWAGLLSRAVAKALYDAGPPALTSRKDPSRALRWLLPSIAQLRQSLGHDEKAARILEDLEICAAGTDAGCERLRMDELIGSALRLTGFDREKDHLEIEAGAVVTGSRGSLLMLLVAALGDGRTDEDERGPISVLCRRWQDRVLIEIEKPKGAWCSEHGPAEDLEWCKGVAGRHGGSLELEQYEGCKARVVIDLPAAESNAGQVA